MKKLFSLLLLVTSAMAFASDAHIEMWSHINSHNRVISILIGKATELEEQLKSIPQGKQGPAGPKGERGPAGVYSAGEGIEIHGSVIQIKAGNKHQIGDEYRGGLIFFVDEQGEHGLIASKIDVGGQGVQWRNGTSGNKVTNARSDGIGAGETNTRLIIAQQTIDNQNGQFAALLAANFQVLGDGVTPCKTPVAAESVCYGGWYLPSAYELQLLHNNLHTSNVSTFAPEFYWSSTEANVTSAWLQNFSSGAITKESKANTIGRVRAISRF